MKEAKPQIWIPDEVVRVPTGGGRHVLAHQFDATLIRVISGDDVDDILYRFDQSPQSSFCMRGYSRTRVRRLSVRFVHQAADLSRSTRPDQPAVNKMWRRNKAIDLVVRAL